MQPDVAVVLPIAPKAEWLSECLASLRNQTLRAWSVVAVLDGACDENSAALDDAGLGSRLNQVQLTGGSGVATALNVGMQHTEASYVARMDADDVCAPSRLELQLDRMNRQRDLWVLGTAADLINAAGTYLGTRQVPTSTGRVHKALLWRNVIIHPSVMMRRDKIMQIGGYSSATDRLQDYELWLRVIRRGAIDNLPQPLLRYRVHGGQHSHGTRLGQTAIIRAGRRAAACGPFGAKSADVKHLAWWTVQHVRERRTHD